MMAVRKSIAINKAIIVSKIIVLREENVILDVHLAELYGVETSRAKEYRSLSY